jgi:hypothetical protein
MEPGAEIMKKQLWAKACEIINVFLESMTSMEM